MDDPKLFTDYERGQLHMRGRVVADLAERGNTTARDRIALFPVEPDHRKLPDNAARRAQRVADYGPFPDTVGTLDVPAMVETAHRYDAMAVGGVAPCSTVIFALLKRITQNAPVAVTAPLPVVTITIYEWEFRSLTGPRKATDYTIVLNGMALCKYTTHADGQNAWGMAKEYADNLRKALGIACEDEGCPHFGTVHDHPEA